MLVGTNVKRKLVFGLAVGLLVVSLFCGCPFRKETPKAEVKPEAEDDGEPKEDMIPRPDLQPKLKAAREKYPDAVAWIHIPGTNIDYPVMQKKKEEKDPGNPFYFRHAEDGKYRLSGSIWTYQGCNFASRKTLSRNTDIGAHNMETGPDKGVRFAQLENFCNINFAHKHPYLFLSIPGEDMVFEVFAVYITDVPFRLKRGPKGFNYYSSDFPIEGRFVRGGDGSAPAVVDEKIGLTWVQVTALEAKKRSLYNYEVEIGKNSKLLTLATCTYKYGKTESPNCKVIEFVVQGKLIPASKKLRDRALLSKNESPEPPKVPNPNVSYVYMAEGELAEEPEEPIDKEPGKESGGEKSDDKKK